LQKSLPPAKRFMQRWGAVLVLAAFIGICCAPATVALLIFGKATAALSGLALAALLLIVGSVLAVRSLRAPDADMLRPCLLELRPEYLEVSGDRGWERRDWSLIARLQTTDELFILHRDDGLVYAVPRRAFATSAEEQAFIAAAQRYHELAQGVTDRLQPAPWQDAAPAAVFAADTLQVAYATNAPEIAQSQRGLVLHPVNEAPQKKKSGNPAVWMLLGLAMAAVFILLGGEDDRGVGTEILTGLFLFPLTALLMVWPALAIVRLAVRLRQKPAPAVRQTLTISPAGVSLWSPRLEARSAWEAIDAVLENEKVIVFVSNRPAPVHLFTIPKPAFPDAFEAQHFAETAARYRGAAHDRQEEQKLAETPRVVSDNPYQPPLAQ
jgi:hypothetical protein